MLTKDKMDADTIVHVLKQDGVVKSVTQHRPSTGVTSSAKPIPGKPKENGTFSTKD